MYRHKARLLARQALVNSVAVTRIKLSPASIFVRWKLRQKIRIINNANAATDFVSNKAGILGIAFGLGFVLAAGLAPIKRMISAKRSDKISHDDES